MTTYKEFHQYSIDKPNEFWTEQAQLVAGIDPLGTETERGKLLLRHDHASAETRTAVEFVRELRTGKLATQPGCRLIDQGQRG